MTTESTDAAKPAIGLSSSVRNYALGILVVVYTLNFIDRQILSILLPAIQAEFIINDVVLGFLAGPAFAIFYALMGVPIATLADRFNRRNIIAISIALWSAMTALSGFSANVVHLALARIGVGVGEAGCSPPAHSMIADYFPPEQRSTAMGIYSAGISVGIMIAFLAGGWVVQNIGWRPAFLIVGVPGLLLALIVRYTVVEPPRGMADGRVDKGDRATIREVAAFLIRRKSFINIALGAGFASFAGYSTITFFASFLVRSFNMQPVEIGLYLGLLYGIGGALGFAGGGYVADRLGRNQRRWSLWGVSIAMLVGGLFAFPVYLGTNPYLMLMLAFVPTVLSNFYLATSFAQIQGLVGLRMRAVASSLMLLILNVIGLGLGPQITGILSEALSSSFGVESMRYALLTVSLIMAPWSAFHYYLAGRHIESDLARVDEKQGLPQVRRI